MAKKAVRKSTSKSSRAKSRSVSRSKSRAKPARSRSVSRARAPVARSRVSKSSRSSSSKEMRVKSNIRIVANNLIVFFLLFLVSVILTQIFSYSLIFQNLFAIFSIAFGFITVAFLITFLVFVFIRLLRRK